MYLYGCRGYSKGGRIQKSQGKKDKKKDKLLLAPLFLHPSDVPFLRVVWKTLTPPPQPNTHSITPLSTIVPIPVSLDLLHSPLHMDKWLGLAWPGPAQMTHNSERSGDDYEEDRIWLLI